MFSDSCRLDTVPLPAIGSTEVMPVALLSGIDFGTSVELNVPLMQPPPPLLTVTPTDAVVLAAFRLSNDWARIWYEPLFTDALFHCTEYGDEVSVWVVPSGSVNTTRATVPSGSDALAETVTVPLTVLPLAGAVIATVGTWLPGCVLPHVTPTSIHDWRMWPSSVEVKPSETAASNTP